jgi:hypothetical protein
MEYLGFFEAGGGFSDCFLGIFDRIKFAICYCVKIH